MAKKEYNELLAEILRSRMGVNPLISVGAPIAGNLVSALVSNQARRRAQERLNSLQTPQLPAFRRNPLLGQRIAQQQQLADQPMMGYQRAADEQAGRQFERGRQIAANLGGGAGLAYMQGVSSNIANQQRKGLLTDMAMQQRNRVDLDQLINMQNQEMAQERAQEQLGYQMAMRDFMDQRGRLQSDINQQQSNIAASIGGIVGDIPNYATAFRNYNTMRDMTPRGENAITPAPMLGGAVSNTYAQEMPIMRGMALPQARQVAPNVIPAPVAPAIAPAISAQAPIRMTEMSPVAIPPVSIQPLPERLPGVIPATSLMARQIPNEALLSPMARRAALNANTIPLSTNMFGNFTFPDFINEARDPSPDVSAARERGTFGNLKQQRRSYGISSDEAFMPKLPESPVRRYSPYSSDQYMFPDVFEALRKRNRERNRMLYGN